MKRKISVRISEQLADRLEAAARLPGARKSSIIEAALDRFLDSDGDQIDDATLSRLDRMSLQLTQLDCDLRFASEAIALHARYHLTITPPLRATEQRTACDLGRERFEEFAAQVARRVHLGTPLMRETMDRLIATSPDLFAHDLEQGVPRGAEVTDHGPGVSESIATNEESELPAAGREDGSNGGFSEERPSPSQ